MHAGPRASKSAAIIDFRMSKRKPTRIQRTSPPLLEQSPRQVQSAATQREQEGRPFGKEAERLERHCY